MAGMRIEAHMNRSEARTSELAQNGRRMQRGSAVVALVLILATLPACSIKRIAVNKLGDSLANSGTTFASDNDPDLIGSALPFSLKLMEGLLAESPRHRGLLLATCSGFTQYSYVYVQQQAEQLESVNFAESQALKARARRLYLRGRDYCLRGLDVAHPGMSQALRENPRAAVAKATVRDVALLYWTAASWGAAISVSKDNPDLIGDQNILEATIDRAYALQPDFDNGTIETFLITYETARQGAKGDFADRSRTHFERVLKLTDGQMAGPYVSMAESVSVAKQNRAEFESLLNKALEINVDTKPEWRLSNVIMQRRARWLLGRADELFVSEPAPAETSASSIHPAYVIEISARF